MAHIGMNHGAHANGLWEGGGEGGVTHVGEGLAEKGDLVLEAHEQTRVVACVCLVTHENNSCVLIDSCIRMLVDMCAMTH